MLCEETSLLLSQCGAHSPTHSLSNSKPLQQNATPARPETGGEQWEGRGKEQQQEKETNVSQGEQRRWIMDPSWNNHRRAANSVGHARRHARRLTSRQGKRGELGADLHRGRHGLQNSPQSPANQSQAEWHHCPTRPSIEAKDCFCSRDNQLHTGVVHAD